MNCFKIAIWIIYTIYKPNTWWSIEFSWELNIRKYKTNCNTPRDLFESIHERKIFRHNHHTAVNGKWYLLVWRKNRLIFDEQRYKTHTQQRLASQQDGQQTNKTKQGLTVSQTSSKKIKVTPYTLNTSICNASLAQRKPNASSPKQ